MNNFYATVFFIIRLVTCSVVNGCDDEMKSKFNSNTHTYKSNLSHTPHVLCLDFNKQPIPTNIKWKLLMTALSHVIGYVLMIGKQTITYGMSRTEYYKRAEIYKIKLRR